METYLRYILPVYFVLYFLFLVVIRSIAVKKEIGKNPIVLSRNDDAHGLISRYFSMWMLALTVYTAIFCFFPVAYKFFSPMDYLQSDILRISGLVILIISLIWTYVAQAHMRASWRIGIDEGQKTDLVTQGVFRYSRNPIYAGMIASVIGLFLATPNALTLMLMAIGIILIQIQVRLEEDFLLKMHGADYISYKNSVARFI